MTRDEFIAENLDIFYDRQKKYMDDVIERMNEEDVQKKEYWEREYNITDKEKNKEL